MKVMVSKDTKGGNMLGSFVVLLGRVRGRGGVASVGSVGGSSIHTVSTSTGMYESRLRPSVS